jgi:hypothetical protein
MKFNDEWTPTNKAVVAALLVALFVGICALFSTL